MGNRRSLCGSARPSQDIKDELADTAIQITWLSVIGNHLLIITILLFHELAITHALGFFKTKALRFITLVLAIIPLEIEHTTLALKG